MPLPRFENILFQDTVEEKNEEPLEGIESCKEVTEDEPSNSVNSKNGENPSKSEKDNDTNATLESDNDTGLHSFINVL